MNVSIGLHRLAIEDFAEMAASAREAQRLETLGRVLRLVEQVNAETARAAPPSG